MSDVIFKAFGIAFICLALSMITKKANGDVGVTVRVAGIVVLAALCLSALSPAIEFITHLSASIALGISYESIGVLLRAMAVAFLTNACASVCRDCGEGTLATYVETAGKIEILILSLPLIANILEIVTNLLDA